MERRDGGLCDLVEAERLSAGIAGGVAVAVGDERLPGFESQAAGGLDGLDVDICLFPVPDIEAARDLRDRRGPGPRLQVVEDGPDPGDTLADGSLLVGPGTGRERLPEHLPDILERKERFERLLNLFFHGDASSRGPESNRDGADLQSTA